MTHHFAKIFFASATALTLAGCASVKMPNVDFLKLPEFQDDAKNIKDYPKVSDAPTVPTDVRSDKAWDKAADSLIETREKFEVPQSGKTYENDSDIQSDIQELKEDVRAYKLDDPQ